jgi:Protein of unknown function (DUF1161)
MNATAKQTTRSAAQRTLPLWWLAASMLVPVAALAQANACDQLKATLAARIEATGVRGYSLEAVPAATPVPAGSKVIGNCEGGERKVLYRRWGGAAAAAAAPAAPAAITAPPPPPKRPPPVQRPTAPALAMTPEPAPAPAVAAAPVAPAGETEVAPKADPVVVPAAPALTPELPDEKPLLSRQLPEFLVMNWRWLLALLVVPLAFWAWAWRANSRAYDKNGLPRGPRL